MWQGDHQDDNRVDVYARLDVRASEGHRHQRHRSLTGRRRSVIVDDLDLPADQRIRLTFDNGQVGATVACNGFGGPYELVDGQRVVDAEEFSSTLIGCHESQGSWESGCCWARPPSISTTSADPAPSSHFTSRCSTGSASKSKSASHVAWCRRPGKAACWRGHAILSGHL